MRSYDTIDPKNMTTRHRRSLGGYERTRTATAARDWGTVDLPIFRSIFTSVLRFAHAGQGDTFLLGMKPQKRLIEA